MKKLLTVLLVVAIFATMALGIFYAVTNPDEYNKLTRAEYRQMVSEGK